MAVNRMFRTCPSTGLVYHEAAVPSVAPAVRARKVAEDNARKLFNFPRQ